MWIKIPGTDGEEVVNFDLVKEFYVNKDTIYVVQLNDEDNINWFKQVNAREANSIYKQICGMLKARQLITKTMRSKDVDSNEISTIIKPTV